MTHSHTTSSDPIPAHQHNVTSIAVTTDTGQTQVQLCDRTLPTACACGNCGQPVGPHAHSLPMGGIVSGMASGASHSHGISGAATTSNSSVLPAWRAANFCAKDGVDLTAIVPEGAIAMFVSACGAGWVEDASFQNLFLRDDNGGAIAVTGGSDTHGHTALHNHGGATASAGGSHTHPSGGTSGNALATHNRYYSLNAVAGSHSHPVAPYGSAGHTHGVDWQSPSVTSDAAVPPFREMIFCKTVAPICNGVSPGMTGFFDWSCPAGWSELTQYRNYFIRGHDGDITFAEAGGTATHLHTVAGHTHAITTDGAHTHPYTTTPLSSPSYFPEFISSGSCSTCYTWASLAHTHGGTMSAAGGHTHTGNATADFTTATAANSPPWREQVLCTKN
jgi:hypothetical protein